MGCDIHLFVERREGDKWVSCDRWEQEDGWYSVTNSFYYERNYDLFAILANVRNGRGFAGVKTGEGFASISEPRGVPADAAPEFLRVVEQWGVDGHSHSYLTVAELMAFDWTQVSCKQGWVDAENYQGFQWRKRRGEGPEEYCGDVFGQGITKLSNDEMQAKIDAKESLNQTYTLVEWTQSYYAVAAHFLSHTLPRLWTLGKPEDVRIVFFFDN